MVVSRSSMHSASGVGASMATVYRGTEVVASATRRAIVAGASKSGPSGPAPATPDHHPKEQTWQTPPSPAGPSTASSTRPSGRTPSTRATPASGSPSATWPCPKVRGDFKDFSGTLELAEDPVDSKISVTIQAGSVDTHDENRDNHLRTNDFFDVENHPTWTFTSTAIRPESGTEWNVDGDLTIRGVTKSGDPGRHARGRGQGPLRQPPGRASAPRRRSTARTSASRSTA